MKREISATFIESSNIKATYDPYLVWCIFFISIGYQYKLIFCGGMGLGLGQTWICYTMIGGISTNHWFEHLVYAPLMWITLVKINQIVFGPGENEILSKAQNRKKWIGQALAALYLYGYGMHITNTVEIWARQHNGITTGTVYELIWWLDEQFSHWVQYISFFPLIAWFVINDRLDRNHSKNAAIITGVLHGVDRGVGVIEGDNYMMAFYLIGVMMVGCVFRWYRHDKNFWRSWQDFFFRHVFLFCITMILLIGSYSFFFGLDIQPSEMGKAAVQVAILGIVIIVIETILVVGLDRLVSNRKNSFPTEEKND